MRSSQLLVMQLTDPSNGEQAGTKLLRRPTSSPIHGTHTEVFEHASEQAYKGCQLTQSCGLVSIVLQADLSLTGPFSYCSYTGVCRLGPHTGWKVPTSSEC